MNSKLNHCYVFASKGLILAHRLREKRFFRVNDTKVCTCIQKGIITRYQKIKLSKNYILSH